MDKEEPRKRGRPKDVKVEKKKRVKKERAKVDVDRQCGVPLVNQAGELTGLLCSRSLTCKSHAMGAKRAVRGRSRPYDVLLHAYQRKNNLKIIQEKKKQVNSDLQREAAKAEEMANLLDPPLPPMEEVNAVLLGATRSLPIPLATSFMVSSKLRSERINMRELLFKTMAKQAPPLPPPLPPKARGSQLSSAMAASEAILGRCVMYNPETDQVHLRPSQLVGNVTLRRVCEMDRGSK